jgi:imidazolonepropionase-like amidohydrolase
MNQAFINLGSKNDLNRWKNDKKNDKNTLSRISNQHLEHLKILKRMHDVSVNIVCGTDAGIMFNAPGFSIHEELQYYKDAGLSNYEVLKTATINVSKVDKKYQNLGSIEIGKIANLLLLNDNPLINLETLKKPKIVFVQGRKLETSDLEIFKAKAKQRNNTIISTIRLLSGMLFN